MNNKVLSRLVVGALATTLALASPALARGGGGGGGGGHGGGMGGGMGGGRPWRRHGWWHACQRYKWRDDGGAMGGGMRSGGMGRNACRRRERRNALRRHEWSHAFQRHPFRGYAFCRACCIHAPVLKVRVSGRFPSSLPPPLQSLCVHWRALRLRRLRQLLAQSVDAVWIAVGRCLRRLRLLIAAADMREGRQSDFRRGGIRAAAVAA